MNHGDIGKTLQGLGNSQTAKNVAAAMLTAGGTGAISGSGCGSGAVFSAVTSTAALGYNSLVGYNANAGPGFNPENPIYQPDQSNGFRQPLAYQGANVIGLNKADSMWSQGSTLSKALNYVPFVNATAGLHDYLFNSGLITMNPLTNIGTMLPSAVFAIPASLGNSNLNWIGTTNLNPGQKK